MKKPVELFTDRVLNLWNEWQIRSMVLLSLLLQIILIIFGSKRKYIPKSWIQILLWLTYLAADWVAIFALGHLAIIKTTTKLHILQPFWAPFLLLHLGGPDTITAYSLEDNELWLRHFLGLVVQIQAALLILFRFWSNTVLSFISIPIFILGVVKYGERTLVLRSASFENFRDSLISKGKFENRISVNDMGNFFREADHLFRNFEYLYANLQLAYCHRLESCMVIIEKSSSYVFELIEVELGFIFDRVYTKASLGFSKYGVFLRSVGLLFCISCLIGFSIFVDKLHYSPIDIIITYFLLIGAVLLEVYAIVTLILSDQTELWLSKKKNLPNWFNKSRKYKRRSNSMAQLNLLDICIKGKTTKCAWIQKFLENYRLMYWTKVTDTLYELIFLELKGKGEELKTQDFDIKLCREMLAQRGDYALKKRNLDQEFQWATIDVEFDHSLLLWHIATDLCYYEDLQNSNNILDPRCKASKCLSDYMFYLLIMCPLMLESRDTRYKDTCAMAAKFFESKASKNKLEACKKLLLVEFEDLSLSEWSEQRDKSVLSHGCKLAHQVKNSGEKWEMISEVWVEMLMYGASHCGWKEHGRRLSKGGELLSHVCLLMAQIGLSEQYRTGPGEHRP